jgi:hypothetical protein
VYKKNLKKCPKCHEHAFRFIEVKKDVEWCEACHAENFPIRFSGGHAPRRTGDWMSIYELSH